MSLQTDQTRLEVGEYIVLYVLDASYLTGSTLDIFYFTQAMYAATPVSSSCHSHFQGLTLASQQYTPIDIVAEGFEVTGQGSLPRPKLTIGNVTGLLGGVVNTYGDILGARIYRYRTLKKYLDGEANADPGAYWPPDVYVLQRKTEHNKLFISWELSSVLDCTGQKIPGRQILRDSCGHIYRRWDSTLAAFDYTYATCPYTRDTAATAKSITNIVTADASKLIEGISQGNPCQITITAHGCSTGDEIYINNNVGGMIELRGKRCFVTKVDDNNFTLDNIDSTSYRAWVSGGRIYRHPSVVVTVPSHGYSTNQEIYFDSDVGGTTQLRNKCYVITVINTNSFSLNNVNSAGYTAYTSGGTVTKKPSWFDRNGNVCAQQYDCCGKRPSDCRLRYPGGAILPTTAFPGVGRVRVR